MAWYTEGIGPAGQNIIHPALDRVMAADRADENWGKFQVRANEGDARLAEMKEFWKAEGRNPGGWNYRQTARPSGTGQWNVGSASSSIGLDDPENRARGWHTKSASDYYDGMRDRNQSWKSYINRKLHTYPEMEEDYNFGYNNGGIASLENRPGYRWGGSPHLDLTKSQRGEMILKNTMDANRGRAGDFGVDWDRGYGNRFNDLVMLESRLKQPTGRLLPDTVRTTWQNALQHGDSDRRYDYVINRATDYGKSLDEDMSLTKSQRGELEDYIARYNPMAFRAEGGAVGLEPGIGSLMGYAKGGMVTRVKVPKGQSKWMKKFMNNMRDN